MAGNRTGWPANGSRETPKGAPQVKMAAQSGKDAYQGSVDPHSAGLPVNAARGTKGARAYVSGDERGKIRWP